jgi:hypothetical protein
VRLPTLIFTPEATLTTVPDAMLKLPLTEVPETREYVPPPLRPRLV